MEQHAVVLMSTYNGRKYIKEQLDSIFAQTWPGVITVLLRDDGSKDDTAAIAKSCSQSDSRKLQVIQAPNVGPQRSFLELVRMAPPAEFYFFADQDDVWDADKLAVAMEAMQDQEGPVCWCSNFRHSHMDLTVYEEQALEKPPVFRPLQILFYNRIPGCVMGFNRALMELVQAIELDNVMMHDSMVLSLAAACGQVLYDPQPRITHRIHQSNVVGHGHKKIVLHKWIPAKLKLLIRKEAYDVSAMAEQFLAVAGDRIHPEYKEDILLLRDFKKCRKLTSALLRHRDTQGSLRNRTALSIRSKIFFHLF